MTGGENNYEYKKKIDKKFLEEIFNQRIEIMSNIIKRTIIKSFKII